MSYFSKPTSRCACLTRLLQYNAPSDGKMCAMEIKHDKDDYGDVVPYKKLQRVRVILTHAA